MSLTMASANVARASCCIAVSECSSRNEVARCSMRGPAPKMAKNSVLLVRVPSQTVTLRAQSRAPQQRMRAVAAQAEAKSVALESDMDVDYTPLEEAMQAGKWRQADDMTRALLITLAGEDAEDREYIYFTEVKNIPVTDLKTIDNLWTTYSDGNFGFSVQRNIWKREKEMWGKFFKKLDWTTGENNSYRSWKSDEYIYKVDAAKGHLPLTSCLRGTQLLRGLLQHEAIAGPPVKEGEKEGGAKNGRPAWLKF